MRVERRRDVDGGVEPISWDEGDPLQFDDQNPIETDDDTIGDGAGNYAGAWQGIGPAVLRCEIIEIDFGSGEEAVATKLRNLQRCTVEVRVSEFTRSITTDDRFRVIGTDRVLNVRHAPPPGRSNFIRFTCEAGVAT